MTMHSRRVAQKLNFLLYRPFLTCGAKKYVSREYGKVSAAIVDELTSALGAENVSTSVAVREHHGHDESFHSSKPPEVVVWPTNVELVSKVVGLCNENAIPVIPFGTGTGMEGGVLAVQGGICINLTKMDQVVDVSPDDFTATVQPGVTRMALNAYLRDTGMWFPIDPGADASLCGMAATSASGTNAVRYGTMRENVANMEVVLPDGRILHTSGKGRATKKTVAGYNLTNLFVGSEGTLGVITQATLRLYGIPESMVSAICSFPDIKSAIETTVQILQCGIPIARIEFLDEVQMDACNRYGKLDYRVAPTLFLEFHGSEKTINQQVTEVGDVVRENGGTDFQWAEDEEERKRLWQARHEAWYAAKALAPGCTAYSTDVCVPLSKLSEVIVESRKDIEAAGVKGPMIGHVGDGNFHALLLAEPTKPDAKQTVISLAKSIARRALSVGGTCTGEHGIGLGKRMFLEDELGAVGVAAMRMVKRAFDPNNIMNPGKVLPSGDDDREDGESVKLQ
ncbi:PREDICTED: probable D-lactate dehydrogenase, mitochondrial isoform X2 [Priapulus caudatus]|uniref:D-lactate dehydrogenase (cytochrome) n=1 Tax=Priapulus caudatus TaxID=37621 RepID=A0ABM1F8T4_PRICU|nr:PREDICTED: probable D-lactate dehydrogenase, mitochondrial isoform X2 [Priapulus caudatus]